MHERGYVALQELREELAGCSMADIGDQIFLLKKAALRLNDLASEMKGVVRLAERLFCMGAIATNDASTVRGKIASSTPKIMHAVRIPSYAQQPEKYSKVLQFLGVPEDVSDLFKPNWPKMVEFFSDLIDEGAQLPPELDPTKTYPVYSVSSRKISHVDESLSFIEEDDDE